MTDNKCPKCGADEEKATAVIRWFDCRSAIRLKDSDFGEGKQCLRNQLAQANARIDELLSERMDKAESKLSTTPAAEHLNTLAERCHALATKRGKYPSVGWPWSVDDGVRQLRQEIDEWEIECVERCQRGQEEEFGDVLHAVLSVGHHMGYDIAECLAGAMERNKRRAGVGEQ